MDTKDVKLLPFPALVRAEEIRKVFETAGFATVTSKSVSLDIYDILVPLLHVLQNMQWWASSSAAAGTGLILELKGDKRFIAVHSAQKDQAVALVPCGTALELLNMPSAFVQGLRQYGSDPQLRAERLEDLDYTEISNEHLDSIGSIILNLFALALTPMPSSVDPKEKA